MTLVYTGAKRRWVWPVRCNIWVVIWLMAEVKFALWDSYEMVWFDNTVILHIHWNTTMYVTTVFWRLGTYSQCVWLLTSLQRIAVQSLSQSYMLFQFILLCFRVFNWWLCFIVFYCLSRWVGGVRRKLDKVESEVRIGQFMNSQISMNYPTCRPCARTPINPRLGIHCVPL